jgi:hypothetical protein
MGNVVGETAVSQKPEEAVVIAHHRRAHIGTRLEDAGSPGMAKQYMASGQDPLTHSLFPIGSLGRDNYLADGVIDLFRNDIDDAVEDIVLVGYVVVERHGLDPEHLCEMSHRE